MYPRYINIARAMKYSGPFGYGRFIRAYQKRATKSMNIIREEYAHVLESYHEYLTMFFNRLSEGAKK